MTRVAILLLVLAFEVQAVEVGDDCRRSKRLPIGFLCQDGMVINCNAPAVTREYLVCRGDELSKLDSELNRKYQAILKSYDKPDTDFADYKKAKAAFTGAQRSWARFKDQDCEMPMYLNLTGSGQSPMMVDCAIGHTRKRIADFDSGFYE